MAQNFKILIVEDEEIIRFGLQDNFEMENYEVETACDGEEAIEKTDSFQPQLVLLDLMIPKKSGFEVCRYIRNKHPECYIIMLTAKTEEASKVAGLEMGADDYVTKPFSILELLARVKAFRRRIEPQAGNGNVVPDVLEFADLKVDIKKFSAVKKGVPLDLTTREYQIIKYFWMHRGEVVEREDLLKDIWGYTDENMPSTRTIDNHIGNLRKKIEDDMTDPRIIISVRGAGYKFDVE
ncbi:two-component system, OmpR family, alkaline phosphatase synthesis response regulator PhoP/two-component system, OmpR family, response regulator VicR [Fibrobacter sp. UWH9]|uniref:response regulator transcription factor n=1 Tax=unclassified Fibrobacter TaxID=2634177 RepID=UPI00091338D1|nr:MULTISPECIES: response regulator transcription factor [Fibrobacter]MCQ2099389.1 response regulator transcription factor [Fibrobacter sp.]MCL4100981.1 Alkaline phosphatase synthesis transcriptional regulatory protein PhoP [Fibrobacter succinogenes]MDO4947370.1 response regulator transcription factor [Fibrobacter sp.]OWV06906.1 two-component system response regulator [Fibrobacter sp. UWH3]OWV16211.1 two-component system response regulator [Fibrobacter sp. UWH1]